MKYLWKQRTKKLMWRALSVIPPEVLRLLTCALFAFVAGFLVTAGAKWLEANLSGLDWPFILGTMALTWVWGDMCDATRNYTERDDDDSRE